MAARLPSLIVKHFFPLPILSKVFYLLSSKFSSLCSSWHHREVSGCLEMTSCSVTLWRGPWIVKTLSITRMVWAWYWGILSVILTTDGTCWNEWHPPMSIWPEATIIKLLVRAYRCSGYVEAKLIDTIDCVYIVSIYWSLDWFKGLWLYGDSDFWQKALIVSAVNWLVHFRTWGSFRWCLHLTIGICWTCLSLSGSLRWCAVVISQKWFFEVLGT